MMMSLLLLYGCFSCFQENHVKVNPKGENFEWWVEAPSSLPTKSKTEEEQLQLKGNPKGENFEWQLEVLSSLLTKSETEEERLQDKLRTALKRLAELEGLIIHDQQQSFAQLLTRFKIEIGWSRIEREAIEWVAELKGGDSYEEKEQLLKSSLIVSETEKRKLRIQLQKVLEQIAELENKSDIDQNRLKTQEQQLGAPPPSLTRSKMEGPRCQLQKAPGRTAELEKEKDQNRLSAQKMANNNAWLEQISIMETQYRSQRQSDFDASLKGLFVQFEEGQKTMMAISEQLQRANDQMALKNRQIEHLMTSLEIFQQFAQSLLLKQMVYHPDRATKKRDQL